MKSLLNPSFAKLSALLFSSMSLLPAATVTWNIAAPVLTTPATTTTWGVATNWSPVGVPSTGGDPLVIDDVAIVDGFPSANSTTTAATATQITLDGNRNIGFLSYTNPRNIIINGGPVPVTTPVSPGFTLTGSAGINFVSAGQLTISAAFGLGANQTWDIQPAVAATGEFAGGLNVTGPIRGAFTLTKTGFRPLTLSGDNSAELAPNRLFDAEGLMTQVTAPFSGGIINKRRTIFIGGFTNPNPLGTGTFTFANENVIPNNEANTLSFLSGFTRTIPNTFVNNNASPTAFAAITTGFTTTFHTITLTGPFITGSAFNFTPAAPPVAAGGQVLTLSPNGAGSGISEFTFALAGDWSKYNADPRPDTAEIEAGDELRIAGFANFNGIRLSLGGTVRIDNMLSIAPTNYIFIGTAADNSVTAPIKFLVNVNGNTTIPRKFTFANVANNRRHTLGTLNSTPGTSTILAGDAVAGAAVVIGSETAAIAPAIVTATGVNLASIGGGSLAVTGRITQPFAVNPILVNGFVTVNPQIIELSINDSYLSTNSVFTPTVSILDNPLAGVTVNTNSLFVPIGVVNLSGDNTYSANTLVMGGTLLATNVAGSATGTGTVTVGALGAAASGQTGNQIVAGTAAVTTRNITGINSTFARSLVIGQSITGANIPIGAVITGVTIGSTPTPTPPEGQIAVTTQNSIISIDRTITVPINTTFTFTDLATTQFSRSATLGGTGTIAGATTFRAESTLAPGLAAGTAGTLSFGGALDLISTSGTIFDINGVSPGFSHDVVSVVGALAQAGTVTLNFGVRLGAGNNTITLINAGSRTGNFSAVNVNGAYGSVALTNNAGVWSGTVGDGTFTFTQSSGQLAVTEANSLTPLQTWRQTFFGVSTNTGLAADTADGDNDGLANLIEYATGSNPTVPSTGAVQVGRSVDGLRLTMTYNRVADSSITYTVEGTTDIVAGPWTTVNTTTGVAAGTVVVEDNVAISAQARRFLRLRITY